MLEYKGYLGSVEYSDEDEVLRGRLELICHLVTYEGADAKGIKAALQERSGSGNLHIWDRWIFCLTAA
jgi:predicted HicB family RNase H-like nuclease